MQNNFFFLKVAKDETNEGIVLRMSPKTMKVRTKDVKVAMVWIFD